MFQIFMMSFKKQIILLIICGDSNLVLNFDLDTKGYIRQNNVQSRKKGGANPGARSI